MNVKHKIEEVIKDQVPDILEALNMGLPFKQPKYKMLECPNCKEVCAYDMPSLSGKCVYVCDWCEFEF